jgi:hypothetical protein
MIRTRKGKKTESNQQTKPNQTESNKLEQPKINASKK